MARTNLIAGIALCLAVVAVVLLVQDSPRASMLLAKHEAKISAEAKPIIKSPLVSAARKAGSAHAGASHLVKLPVAVVAAEKQAAKVAKLNKEKMLASAAKSAMKEYSTFQKHAKDALEQENKRVKTLVTSAAKELMKEEALEKQKRAAKREEEGFWGAYHEKKARSAASRWKSRMQAAEKAALDVIQRSDSATHKSAEQWHNYAAQQKKKAENVAKHEVVLEKKQDAHIKKMIKEGKLSTASTSSSKKSSKPAKPLTPQQKAKLAKQLALKRANALLEKQDKDVKEKVREIAKKELPRLESHLKNQESNMEGRKHWDKLQRAAAKNEQARESKWRKTVKAVHENVAKVRSADSHLLDMEAKKDAKLSNKVKAENNAHLETQIRAIVGSGSPVKKAVQHHKLAAVHQKTAVQSTAGRKVVAALKHIAKVTHAKAAKKVESSSSPKKTK